MSNGLGGLLADARQTAASDRAALATDLRRVLPAGCLLVETCHRVELYGPVNEVEELIGPGDRAGLALVRGEGAARHLLRVAVGRESAIVAEDQLLHQLRLAVAAARARGPLGAELDRLVDICLRAGRRARSWLPAKRPSLAELALQRFEVGSRPRDPGTVLVVGAGDMARRAARALRARGARLLIANRTPERALALAAAFDAQQLPFDPGPAVVAQLDGLLLALSGRWLVGQDTAAAVVDGRAWVIDLSAPSALHSDLAARLGSRLVAIDDLAPTDGSGSTSDVLAARLDRLVEQALAEYVAWVAAGDRRDAARELAARAAAARQAELSALWERIPQLEQGERTEVEQMASQLTERLLRDPLQRLQQDADGSQARAARDLFRL